MTVQEEFFHTFNALIQQPAQIILTSDRPPHEINLMEDRLRSRFEAGLMIDIQQPSFELRTAILLIKAQASNLDLPMELAQLIASKVDSARRIEGIVTQLRSEVELKNRQITQELIQEITKSEALNHKNVLRVKPQDVIKTVANHYRIKQSAIKGKRRTKEIVAARHTAMFFLRHELNMPLQEIGRWFSGRDHTSVMHATNKIEKEMIEESMVQRDISAIKMSLNALSKS
jgi:chromosomal replication initiator protein